ncbi:hypothetical protein ACTFIZ_005302 [Dictyostelium cf. discoideum]
MGHIINPNIYRLGKMVPWVSSGFKRKKNERTKQSQKGINQQKLLKLKKLLVEKRLSNNKYNNIYLTAPITIDKQVTAQGLSNELAKELRTYITPKRTDKINYSLARDIRQKAQNHERIYIYKDNTFEKNKIKDRLSEFSNIKENETYKQLYSKKLLIKIHKIKYKRMEKCVVSYKFPKRYHGIDSLYFKTQARYANNYLFAKGKQSKQLYNSKKKYIEVIRKNETLGLLLKRKNVDFLNRVDNYIIDAYEYNVDEEKFQSGAKKVNHSVYRKKPYALFLKMASKTIYRTPRVNIYNNYSVKKKFQRPLNQLNTSKLKKECTLI